MSIEIYLSIACILISWWYKTKINLEIYHFPSQITPKIKEIKNKKIRIEGIPIAARALSPAGKNKIREAKANFDFEALPKYRAWKLFTSGIRVRKFRSTLVRDGYQVDGGRERERERNISIFSSRRTTRGTWPSCALRCIREWERCATHGVITLRVPISILDSLRFTKRCAGGSPSSDLDNFMDGYFHGKLYRATWLRHPLALAKSYGRSFSLSLSFSSSFFLHDLTE